MVVAAAGALASLACRAHLLSTAAGSDRVYYGSDTVAFALLSGAFLVAFMSGRKESPSHAVVAFVAVVSLIFICRWAALPAAQHALPWVAVATSMLIWAACGAGGLRLLEGRVLCWFGQRSYGIYLWHCPIAWALRVHLEWSWPMLVLVAGTGSLLIAEISYRLVERRWLTRGNSRVLS
jgi:peptidoglycan/LPS O-acetylase OafA/YrhL